jgi:hypothetical protein
VTANANPGRVVDEVVVVGRGLLRCGKLVVRCMVFSGDNVWK